MCFSLVGMSLGHHFTLVDNIPEMSMFLQDLTTGFSSFSNIYQSFSLKQFNFVPKNNLDQKSILISNLFQPISILCHHISYSFNLKIWLVLAGN